MPPAEQGTSRPFPRTLLLVAAALLIAKIATGIQEERARPGATGADTDNAPRVRGSVSMSRGDADHEDLVQWRPIANARVESAQSGKPLLYDFMADWCGPCQRMSREVFSDSAAARRINATFVPVRVRDRAQEEGRNSAEVALLQAQYHVEAFPTLIVVSTVGGAPIALTGYGGKEATLGQLMDAAEQLRMVGGSPSP